MFADVQVVGKGDYNYSDKIFSNKPDENERVLAIQLAKSNAVLAFANTLPDASRKLFEEKRAQFLSNPDRYIIRHNIAKDELKKDARIYTIVIEAVIDDAKIRNDIGDSYGSKDSTMAKNDIGIFIVAREVSQSQAFKEKNINVKQKQNENSESRKVEGDESNLNSEESSSTTEIETTGGSTIRKSDELEYKIDTTTRNEFMANLMDVFTENGINNLLRGDDFDTMKLIEKDFITDNTTNNKTISELKEEEPEMKYIIIGTVDMGAKGSHPSTGQPSVSATVSISICDITGKRRKTVVELRPITRMGTGADQALAKKQALTACAKGAALEIIDKLRGKGLL